MLVTKVERHLAPVVFPSRFLSLTLARSLSFSLPHSRSFSLSHFLSLTLARSFCLSLGPRGLTIFNTFLERIMTDALEDHEGTVSIIGRTITNLRFADDIDAVSL